MSPEGEPLLVIQRDAPSQPKRSPSTRARPAKHSTITASSPSGCSSPAATNPAPNAPNAGSARYRTGTEGRISHLKRRYGMDRSRLKGEGRQIWTGWSILADNADTLAVRTR